MSSLTHVLNKFDAIGNPRAGMSLTLDFDFLGSAEVVNIFDHCLGLESLVLTVNSWDRSENNDYLRLNATTTLLNLESVIVSINISELNSDLHFVTEITIPGGWKFSKSFPDLPVNYPNIPTLAEESDEKAADELIETTPSFIDELSWGSSKFILTNQSYTHKTTNSELLTGLSFVGELFFVGKLRGLSTVTGSEGPVSVSGPVVEYRRKTDPAEFLGIRLKGDIFFDTSSFPLSVDNCSVYIKCQLYPGQVDHSIDFTKKSGVYFFGSTEFSGHPIQLIGRLNDCNGSKIVSFYAKVDDFALSGFSSLTKNIGGDDLDSSLPSELSSPSGIQLVEFGVDLDFTKRSLISFMLGFGIETNWVLIDDLLTIKNIGTRFIINNPFSKKSRKLRVGLSAALDLKGTLIGCYAEFPGYNFGGGLLPGETLPLGNLIESLMSNPPDLPEMMVSELLFYASPKENTFNFECEVSDLLSFPVGDTSFDLNCINVDMSYAKDTGVTGVFSAEMRIAEATAILVAEMTEILTLSGTFSNFDLKKFWKLVAGGDTLPDELPDIVFEMLTVNISPSDGNFSLMGNANIEWDNLPFEGSINTQVEFSFGLDKSKDGAGKSKKSIDAKLSLQGTGPAGFTDDFIMKTFNFLFNYKTNQGWKLGGGATVDIFDHELYLQASYEDSKTLGRIFQLTTKATPEVKLISMKEIGYYSFSQLDLKINRKKIEGKKDQTYWDFRLNSTLAIDNVFTVSGFLSIFNQEDGRKGLLFNPDKGTSTGKIDFPGAGSGGVNISLFEAGFTKESVESGWGFTGTVDVAFKGMPGWMDDLLPSTLHAKLVAGKKDVSISAIRVTDAMPVVLPKMDGESMGTIYFQLTEVGIAVKPSAGLVLEAGLGFSKEVNNFFGGTNIFRVYEKGNKLTLARTKFIINQSGISAQFINSPFAGANAVVINGESWFDVDLGEYGALRLKMPTFKYDGVTQYFEAGGGVEITRPLAIPLKPIKMLLEGVKLKAAADVLPNSIPIKSVDIVDNNGDFKVDELIKLLEEAGKMPSEIKDLLNATGDLLDRFPDTFKQYFNFVVPEKLEFKFGFSPTGRITFGLKTGKTPIRILQPAMVQGIIPMPGLNGIELREISLGTIASGSLFQLTIDGHVDTFDFATLALSLALPSDKSFPLPTSDELQRRLVMKNVFMVIPLQAGVPIPIPIFYDQVGLEYLGIEGVGLQGHIGMPLPKLSGLPQFFSTLKQFFSDRKYLLDPKKSPGVDLKFELGDNYFQLPEYLGGKVLGMKNKPVTISAWSGLAHALNFMKTISINELIQAIPIENRVGSADSSFAFFNFNADWLITTPKEFRDGAYKKMNLSNSDKEDFVAVLPTVAASASSKSSGNEEGLVVFLRGEADLFIVKMETVFGLAASGSMGFATGFKFTGTLAKIIEMEIGGAVAINAPKIDESGSFSLPETPALPAADAAELPAGTPLALAFDGSSSYVKVPDSGRLNFKGTFTIEALVKFSKFDKTWQAILTKGDDSWRLHRYGNTNKISFGTSGLSNNELASKQILKVGQWYHIAAVYTGKKKLIYINGEPDNAIDVTGKLDASNYPTMFGDNAERPGRRLNGCIGEVRIWNAARSNAAIQADMYLKLSGKERNLNGCWRFEQGYGNTAVDICGKNHGIIQTPAWKFSNLLQLDGLAFNGQNSYVELPKSKIDFTKGLTIEAWVYFDSLNKWSRVVDFGNKACRDSIIFANEGTTKNLMISLRRGAAEKHLTAKGVLETGKWMHLAASVDTKGNAKLYKNGKIVQTGAVHLPKNIQRSNNYLGKSNWPQDDYFHGKMDEVRIWNIPRSAAEIRTACKKQLSGKENGLIACWLFRRGFGSAVEDIAGANHGTLKAATWQVPTKIENAAKISGLTFDGSGSYIEIPDNAAFRISKYTVECWIKPQKSAAWAGIIGKPGRNFNIWLSKNGFIHHRFKVGGNDNAGAPNTAKGSIKWNEWNHVAITNDGKTVTTYINGIQAASGPSGGVSAISNTSVIMGRSLDGRTSSFYKGILAEVRIWNRARSAKTIQSTMFTSLTGKEPGLKGYWPMDEGGGAIVQDYASNLDASVKQPGWTDKFKMVPRGLVFDGKNSFLQIPDSSSLQVSRYTVECWIKPQKPAAWAGIVGKPGRNFNIWLSTDGYIHHRFKVGNNNNLGAPNTPNGSIKWGEWNHVAITNDGKTAKTYINGLQAASGPSGGTPAISKNSIIIGRSLDDKNSSYFNGNIDEIRIWSNARSIDLIQADMHRSLIGNEPGLSGYWKMNKGFGKRLTDFAGNGNDGAINGASWTMVSSPKDTEIAAVQMFGHTHLDMLGHRILSGDIRLINDTFWFRGTLNLFPSSWPIKVYGDVEGLINKGDFKVAGEVDTALAGMTLVSAKFLLTNDYTRVEGTVFGAYLILEIFRKNRKTALKGSLSFKFNENLHFGTIRIGKLKVADGIDINIDIGFEFAIVVSQSGFQAKVAAQFKINGKGFNFSFTINVAPKKIEDMLAVIKKEIIDSPIKYIGDMFSDAGKWLEDVGSGAIKFVDNTGKEIGKVLNKTFKVAEHEVTKLMKGAGRDAKEIANALGTGYAKSVKDVAKLMKNGEMLAQDVGKGLKNAFNSTTDDAAKALKGAGYVADDVGKALKGTFSHSADTVGKALNSAGYTATEVGNVMKNTFNKPAKDVAKFMKNTLKMSDNVVNGALKGAGYAANDVKNAMEDAFGWFKDVGKTLEKTFNPSKW